MAAEKTRSNPREPGRLARLIPLLQWAPGYQHSWLRFDLIAGLTVTALVVPKALGYAVSPASRSNTACTPQPRG